MSKKVYLALSFLIVAGLACSFFAGNTAPASQTTQAVATEDQPSTSSDFYEATPTKDFLCQPEKWKVVPIGKYEFPMQDGWKLIIIEVAIQNQSQYWGSFMVWPGDNVSVTTEAGFAYPLAQQLYNISTDPPSPYGGRTLNSSIDIRVGVMTSMIAPGFNVRGRAVSGQYRDVYPYILAFQVADSQNQFILHINYAGVNCILPDGSTDSGSLDPIVLNIDKDMGSVVFPTERPKNDFGSMNEPFTLPDIGTLNFLEIQRYNDGLLFKFNVVNASAGYPMSGELNGYVIGDDGIIRSWDCVNTSSCWNPGGFEAGPGLTAEGQLEFWVPKNVNNLKFLWFDEQLGIYQVLNVPEN